jgi:hypothetical protein
VDSDARLLRMESQQSRLVSLIEDSVAITNALLSFADTSFNSPDVPVASEIPVAENIAVGISVSMVVGNPVRNSWQYYLALFERCLVGTAFKIIRSRTNAGRVCIVRKENPNSHLLIIPNVDNNRYMKAIYVIYSLQCNGDMEYFINHHQDYLTEDNVASCCALGTPPIIGT